MTTRADPPPGSITYVEYLQREIADRLEGVWTCCGPPIADWPNPWEPLLGTRPNAALEHKVGPAARGDRPGPRPGSRRRRTRGRRLMTTLISVYNDHAREMGQNITSSGLDTRRHPGRCSAFTNLKRDKRAGRRDLPRHDGPP